MEDFADASTMLGLVKTPEGISPVERLLNEFEAHEAAEEKSLEYYRKALGEMPTPLTRFLMQLIISDEEKHRAVVHAMTATLRGSLHWTRPEGSLEGSSDPKKLSSELRAATESFIELEKAGIRDYKKLASESGDYYQGLFKVLIDSMVRDSEKHVQLLEFLKERLKQA